MTKPETTRWLLPLLLVLCVVRLWLMPLPSSFWLDETATIFVARYGANHPSLADAAPQAWRSWYYPAIHFNGALFGFSEIATRLPSIVAMAAFLWLVGRLARRLIHPEAAWFAVFACLALSGINYQAANARPYAFGMCLFAAGLLFEVRWLDSGKWRDALLFVLAAALVLRMHLMFWPSCLVYPLYAAARLARREGAVRWGRAIVTFAVLGLALLPVVLESAALLREARAHVISPPPRWREFFRSFEPTLLLVCGAGAWLVSRWRKWQPISSGFSISAAVLIAAWWLCQPLFLFAFSWLTGEGVFVGRYLQLAQPGAAMAAAALAAWSIPSGRWRQAAALLAIGGLLWVGQWRTLWPRHHNSDWRAAAAAVNRVEAAEAAPILCPSPFIEARAPAWRPDYPLPGFLYSQLSVYPVHGPAYLLPFEDSREADSWASRVTHATLLPARRFLIYAWLPQATFWREWFAARPEFAGWRQQRLGPFADVDVILFEAR